MPSLSDRIWFISGGASGLGRATAQLFSREGAFVVILDINEQGSEVATSLGQEKALFAKCNVTQEQDIVSAIQSATQKWPNKSIGGVVCCGGLSDGALTIDHEGNPADLKPFEKLVQVNLIGSYNLSRLVASEMVRRGGGRGTEEKGSILLVSSTSYQDPQPGLAGYAASKGGVASLVLPLSQDLARFGIRVNAVAPSMFETAMMQGIAPRARKAIESRFVFPKRAGQPEEFAHLAKAIAENTYLNGTVIRLDGGTRMSKM